MNPLRLLPRLAPVLLALATVPQSHALNRIWDGGDPDFNNGWSARTNWVGNSNIVAGDALFFPAGPTVKSMQNDLTISNFTKLTFNDDGYVLGGNPLRLTNGITVNHAGSGTTRLNVGLTLGAAQSIEADGSLAALELNGPVNLLSFTLTNAGTGRIRCLSPISGSGTLRKRESGTLELRGTNPFTGTLEIFGGDVIVDGRLGAATVAVNNGGTLGGTGLVSAVTVNAGGQITPNEGGTGTLSVSNHLFLATKSVFAAVVNSNTPGTFDQLNVFGSVVLSNAIMQADVRFIPAGPTQVIVINNDGSDPVQGTFAGLPAGAVVQVTDTTRTTITYTGGTGNDVALIVSPVQSVTWSGAAGLLWSLGGNWVGGTAPQAGDTLVFPQVAVRHTGVNDLPVDTVFGQVQYHTNYLLTGSRVALRRGIQARHSGALGFINLPLRLAADQTFTNAFQDLQFREPIDLNGFDLTFRAGPVAAEYFIDTSVTGSGSLINAGRSSVILLQGNTFAGTVTADASVQVRDPAALGAATNRVVVTTNGVLFLLGSLPPGAEFQQPLDLGHRLDSTAVEATWAGPVELTQPTASFSVGAGVDFSLSGGTDGAFGFHKTGVGRLVVHGNPALHGGTNRVMAGSLQVDTTMNNSALVVSNGATLSGTGLVRQVTVLPGGILSPAGGIPGTGASPAILTITQSLAFQGTSVFRVNLNAPAGTGHDRVRVNGTVNLGAGTAALELGFGYKPAVGTPLVILENDGADAISGFFAGLPEGIVFFVEGRRLRINYTGGTGNDVVLTAVAPDVLVWTGTGPTGFWGNPANWLPSRVPRDGDRLIFPGGTPRRTSTNNLAGLALHSLVFPDPATNNQGLLLRGQGFSLSDGLSSTNPAVVTIQVPVTLADEQTFDLQGPVVISGGLTLERNLSVTGSGAGRLELDDLTGTGKLSANGPTLEINGTVNNTGGVIHARGLLIWNALQTAGPGPQLAQSTFRCNAGLASVRGLLLASSRLELIRTTALLDSQTLLCDGDLEFTGPAVFVFEQTSSFQTSIQAAGAIRLNNASLVVSNLGGALGVPVVAIRNLAGAPVSGTFNGLPEDAQFNTVAGAPARISYTGGAGRDVTFTPVFTPTGITRVWRGAGTTALWSEPANWVGGVVPDTGDSIEFPNAPRPVNTNNLGGRRFHQIRFTGTSGIARTNDSSPGLQLTGGLEYRDTGTVRFPIRLTGPFTAAGIVEASAPQTFLVNTGGHVIVDAIYGLPGATLRKAGAGTLEFGFNGGFLGIAGAHVFHDAGTLRIGQTDAPIDQSAGQLEIGVQANEVRIFGGRFQSGPNATNDGVILGRLDAGNAGAPVVISPGGDTRPGHLTATNGMTLNSNVTLRLNLSGLFSVANDATSDRVSFADHGDFNINGARLEMDFDPGFQIPPGVPSSFGVALLTSGARTNVGEFAGLPQLSLLTNRAGVFRIYYRDLVLPFPLGAARGVVALQLVAARPVMITVTNGPGSFRTALGGGTPGTLYVIEASTDLEHWVSLGGVTAGAADGRFQFIDVTGEDHRFYRARLP